MAKSCLFIALLLALGACSKQIDSPAVDASPSTTESLAADSNRPPPADRPVNAESVDAELEAAIRATDPDYAGADQVARYATGRSDLDGDGNPEVFVYLMGPYFCGSGGCNLLVFSQGMDGYKLLANIPTSDPPVIIAESSTNGFKDFWRMQAGGGAPPEYVKHTFKNGKYIEKSRQPGNDKPSGIEVLSKGIDFASGIELEPGMN